jgi:hypothetical protein
MHRTAEERLWARTRRLTVALLLLWLLVSVVGPWFARDLNKPAGLRIPRRLLGCRPRCLDRLPGHHRAVRVGDGKAGRPATKPSVAAQDCSRSGGRTDGHLAQRRLSCRDRPPLRPLFLLAFGWPHPGSWRLAEQQRPAADVDRRGISSARRSAFMQASDSCAGLRTKRSTSWPAATCRRCTTAWPRQPTGCPRRPSSARPGCCTCTVFPGWPTSWAGRGLCACWPCCWRPT